MANKQRGEIPLSVDGKDYVLFLGTNALELLEEHFSALEKRDVGWQEVIGRVLAGRSIRYMKAFVWAALQEHQPGMTLQDAGRLIDKSGGIESFAKQIAAAAGVALPTEADLKALGIPTDRPQTAQETARRRRGRSTGTVSTATRAASA